LPQVSILILTKNRASLLEACLRSIDRQTFRDFEVVLVNDGSTDTTPAVIDNFASRLNIRVITHSTSHGITKSRREALLNCTGEFVAMLDDDDEWADPDKLERQVAFFQSHPGTVLIGGGRLLRRSDEMPEKAAMDAISRPGDDATIRKTMLLRNNFFTSTVMFRRTAAMAVGGFIDDGSNVTEDYDLWLRLGTRGEMHNFPEPLDIYRVPAYTKEKFRMFLRRQLELIGRHRKDYPYYRISAAILRFRIALGSAPRI
jgi:glycosyltransferase involved in cell wall biosynthesis